jgi:hypothetical protein
MSAEEESKIDRLEDYSKKTEEKEERREED